MKPTLEEVHVDELLTQVLARRAIELRLEAGLAPLVRRADSPAHIELDYQEASQPQAQAMLYDILSDAQITRFENEMQIRFSHRMGRGIWFIGIAVRTPRGIASTWRAVGKNATLPST